MKIGFGLPNIGPLGTAENVAQVITHKPLGADRFIFAGTLEQVREDAQACARIGAHELIYDVTFHPEAQTIAGWLAMMDKLRKLI
jgi:hypothetical protein